MLYKGQWSKTVRDFEDNVPFSFDYNCFGQFEIVLKAMAKLEIEA